MSTVGVGGVPVRTDLFGRLIGRDSKVVLHFAILKRGVYGWGCLPENGAG